MWIHVCNSCIVREWFIDTCDSSKDHAKNQENDCVRDGRPFKRMTQKSCGNKTVAVS